MLGLARHHPFARGLVNSGRLSVPSFYVDSPLNTADADAFAGRMVPGAPMDDAPVAAAGGGSPWLLPHFGQGFRLMIALDDAAALDAATAEGLAALRRGAIPVEPIVIAREGGAPGGIETLHDVKGRVRERYDLQPGTVYLVRPDQHVAARWRRFDPAAIEAALRRASGQRA